MGRMITATAGMAKKVPAGQHIAEITNVTDILTDVSKHPWSDPTQQVMLDLRIEGYGDLKAYQSYDGFKERGDNLSAEIAKLKTAQLKAVGIDKAKFDAMPHDEQVELLEEKGLIAYAQKDEYGSADKEYILIVKGDKKERIKDAERTATCMEIIGRFGPWTGICEPKKSFDTDDLIGQEIGIEVVSFDNKNGKTYSKVANFMHPDSVKVS
jgi:hypothetical protein